MSTVSPISLADPWIGRLVELDDGSSTVIDGALVGSDAPGEDVAFNWRVGEGSRLAPVAADGGCDVVELAQPTTTSADTSERTIIPGM